MTNPPDFDESGNPIPRTPLYRGPTTGWVLVYENTLQPYGTAFSETRAAAINTFWDAQIHIILMGGFTTVGDLGAGAMYTNRNATSLGPMAFQDGNLQWWNLVTYNGELNLGWFGAVWDGTTDDSAVFQAAVDYAKTLTYSSIHLPANAGKISVPIDLAALNNCTIQGTGKFSSNIIIGITSGTTGLFYNSSGTSSEITFRDFGVTGRWLTVQNLDNVYPFLVTGITGLEFLNLYIRYSTAMSISPRGCDLVKVHNCTILESAIDGISLYSCTRINIQFNIVYHCGDDGISFGSEANVSGPELVVQDIVSNNTLVDCQGIRASGVRRVSIANNNIRACWGFGILIVFDPSFVTPYDINIIGNTINDIFNPNTVAGPAQDSSYYISIQAFAQAGNATAIPGQPTVGSGAFVNLYTNLNNVGNGGTIPQPGTYWANIIGNVCSRTVVPGILFSALGVGSMFRRTGYINPTLISAACTLGPCLALAHTIINFNVSDNVFNGTSITIGYFGATIDKASGRIANNLLTDFGSASNGFAAIVFDTIINTNIIIENNIIDGDPFCALGGRNADGSWVNNASNPGIYAISTIGLDIKNNTFRNVYQPVLGGTNHISNNRIDCQPTALGWNAANKGVGFILRGGREYYHMIIDSTPSSATYGKILNAPLEDSGSMPNSGTYVEGWFVHSNVPAIGAGKLIFGWARLTTGSGHVLNTDWSQAFVTIA